MSLRESRLALCLTAGLCLCPGLAGGQTPTGPSNPAATARKTAVATRLEGPPPDLDGRLDDAAWRDARWISDFVQKMPNEGAAPTERTEVAFRYDGDALWVAARMYSRDPSSIQALMSRRDNGGQSQHIWISLDTFRDRRTAYSFGVTAAGVRMDWYHAEDDESDIDASYDPVWEARTRIDSLGWTAEMRIPFSQLRFTAADQQVWGLNIDRWIPERNEDVFWIPVPTSVQAWSSRMGDLVGIAGIRPTRRLEVMPYAASNVTIRESPNAANPFDGTFANSVRAGADLKMGLGPGLTLSATFNPDFGQVEADPAVVNLSAFEVIFSERRPFFTESSDLLDAGGYFYSRRIGAPPRGPANGDFVKRPSFSTILGAAKLTGRPAPGWSVGALTAVTSREYARTYDAGTDTFGRTEVAPFTAYGVARVQRQFGESQSTAALLLTGVRRDLAEGPLAERLHRSAVTGRADWNLRFQKATYQFTGNLGFSHVEGDTAALRRTQLSSAHYFQRPDADYVTFDPTRTSLDGHSASLGLEKISGRHWLWSLEASVESPGLERNDIGRLANADGAFAFAQLRYRDTRPSTWYQRYSLSFSSENGFNYHLDRQFAALRTDASLTLRNFWVASLTAWIDLRGQDQYLTRGGPSMATPVSKVVIASLRNSTSARTAWNARVYYGRNELDGLTYRLSGGLSFRPVPSLQVSVAPNYLRDVTARQYVATRPGGRPETFGSRYVFARLDETTWLAQIRLNYAITPDLTLELYAEPFTASGRFYQHGELTAPRSFDLRQYGTNGTTITQDPGGSYTVTDGGSTFSLPNLDFNVRSFRSNAVLRWEWRRGSTLFLVWQQDRFSETDDGSRVPVGSLFDALGRSGESFLAVKATYWLPVR